VTSTVLITSHLFRSHDLTLLIALNRFVANTKSARTEYAISRIFMQYLAYRIRRLGTAARVREFGDSQSSDGVFLGVASESEMTKCL
jgi:hypothetical protein